MSLTLLALWTLPASAWGTVDPGLLLADDLEQGISASTWTTAGVQPGVTLDADAKAAHRGALGLRLDDRDSSATSGPEGYLDASLPAGDSFYLRFWLRLSPVTDGSDRIAVIVESSTGYITEAIYKDSSHVALAGRDSGGTYVERDAPFALGDGQWHLVQVSLTGVGTAAATRRLRVDGALLREDSFGLASTALAGIRVGSVYSSSRVFTGTVDFDDLRVSSVPPAEALALAFAASATAFECLPVSVTLRDFSGALAGAPYAIEIAVRSTVGPAVELFRDPECTQAAPGVALGLGEEQAQLFARFVGTGTATLEAAHLDFLAGTQTVEVARAAEGHRDFDVLCGCSGSAPATPLAALWSLALLTRRRAHSCARKGRAR